MMSSSMANTASVSISSYGKKRLLSLFSAVLTTFRGTRIFGHRESREKHQHTYVTIRVSFLIGSLSFLWFYSPLRTSCAKSFWCSICIYSQLGKKWREGKRICCTSTVLIILERFTSSYTQGLLCPLQKGNHSSIIKHFRTGSKKIILYPTETPQRNGKLGQGKHLQWVLARS